MFSDSFVRFSGQNVSQEERWILGRKGILAPYQASNQHRDECLAITEWHYLRKVVWLSGGVGAAWLKEVCHWRWL